MIYVKIFSNGVQTHGGSFESEQLANTWIVRQENKSICPFGRPGVRTGYGDYIPAITEKWYKLRAFAKLTDDPIRLEGGYTVSSTNGDVLGSRESTDGFGRPVTEVNVKASYTVEITNDNNDSTKITEKKKEMIKKVRNMTIEIMNEQYDNEEIDMINIRSINALSKGNAVPAAFDTMFTVVKGINDTKQACLTEIRACTTMTQLKLIQYNGVLIF